MVQKVSKKGQKQKQRQSQSVVVNINKPPRMKGPSLQKAAAPVQRPTMVIPAADRFIPPGYAQPSLADIFSAVQNARTPLPPSSLQRQSLQPTPTPSLASLLSVERGLNPAPFTSPSGRIYEAIPPKTISQTLYESSFGLSDTLHRTLAPVNKGLATFLGATGRLMESAITPETDGSTPPSSTFLRTVPPASVVDDLARGRGSFNPLPQPPLPRPLLPTETETPLPQQTVFELLTRPGASTVVPSVGLVPETESLLTPEEEATFVDVEGIVEEEPSPELKEFLTPALPLTQTAASLSSGEAAEESPRTAAALAESERSVRGLTAKERAAQRFEVFRAQLRIMGRPTDDESVKDYIYELEQKG
jgi:hypothetical protein